MITPSFSPTATERVLPKLALDFTTANLDSRVTFTRTTDATHPATYTNSSGIVTAATNNQPRFDYDPVALTCKGLLIEESRENKFAFSSQFNDASWRKVNTDVSADVVVSPDGTTNADKMFELATNTFHCIEYSGLSFTSGAAYTFSIYAKASTRNVLQFVPSGAAFPLTYINFNLTTGVVSAIGSSITGTITNVGNSWFRCTATMTATATVASTWMDVAVQSSDTATRAASYQGDGSSGIYIWGAQLEAGAFATSYIPTTSAALTRNADVATMTGTNFSSWYNQTEGAFEATVIKQANGGLPYFFNVTDGTASNNITCFSYTNNDAEFQIVTGGASQANPYTAGSQLLAGNSRTLGLSYKNSYFYGAFNGAAMPNGNPVASGTVPTLTYLQFGMYSAATNRQGFWIQKLRYWPQALTNAETIAFSK